MGPADRFVGKVLKDTYRIDRLIGRGGMGAVYAASHSRLPRHFAVKLLLPAFAEYPEVLARFRREAQVTSALGHPHIIEVFDFDETEDHQPYIVMELLEGESLAERLSRVRQLSLEQAASILGHAASALQAAHEKEIVHRDLKPPNLFLCRRGQRDDFLKVVDFGISKVLGSATEITRTRELLGTPVYMSPEQAEQKTSQIDLRTDVYAMGVILYQMLAGEPPFSGSSIPDLLFKVVYEEAPPLSLLRPDLPEGIGQVVATAMAKRREDRFGSMEALWSAFQGAAPLAAPAFDPPSILGRTLEWSSSLSATVPASVLPATEPAIVPHAETAPPSFDSPATLAPPLEDPYDQLADRVPRRRVALAVAGVAVVGLAALIMVLVWPSEQPVAGDLPPAAAATAGRQPDARPQGPRDASLARDRRTAQAPDSGTLAADQALHPDRASATPAARLKHRPRTKRGTHPRVLPEKETLGDDIMVPTFKKRPRSP